MINKLLPSKIILVFIIMICSGMALGIIVYSLAVFFAPNPPASDSESIANPTIIDLNLVPADWGKVIKTDNYFNREDKIPNVYVVNFANDVNGIFQDGVNLIAYSKIKEQGKCIDYDEDRFQYFDNNSICYITENGIYDLNTKKSVIFAQDYPFSAVAEVQVSPFVFFDSDGKKASGIFSPLGKYFAEYVDIYEGCGMNFVDTATGQFLGDQEENYMIFNCDSLVNFSKDEKTFAVRSIYGGMNSPKTQFSVIQGNRQFEILPKIISGESEFRDEKINPVDDFIISSINDSEVKFNIIKEAAYYKKGSYVFTFSTNEVIKE